ncbi:hypothetical protein JCM8097_002303 [Rhodosporidiobolus ruineniae]
MLPPLRNPYAVPPDFAQLALDVPAFSPFVRASGQGRATIDWKDDAAVRALTSALLERDFGLGIDLPSDRLCPTIPSRLEYAIFVLRLSLLTSDAPSTSTTSPLPLVGLDIGTGASVVYPLLAQRLISPISSSTSLSSPSSSANLAMLATDIEPYSLSFAARNLAQNGLEEKVKLFKVDEAGAIFPGEVVQSAERIDFTMCNPPFYASEDEIASSLASKELEPFAVCTGGSNELLTAGGEVAFVSRMVEESLSLGLTKIRWFTSLLGKFSSIAPLVELLKAHKISNYAVTPLRPHGQTTRWVLAWSLQDWRFPPSLIYPSPFSSDPASTTSANPSSQPTTRFLPPSLLPSTHFLPLPTPVQLDDPHPQLDSAEKVKSAVEAVLEDLVGGGGRGEEAGLEWEWGVAANVGEGAEEDAEGDDGVLTLRAYRNVWSRAARRAAARGGAEKGAAAAPEPAPPREQPLLLAIQLRVRLPADSSAADGQRQRQVQLLGTWVRGASTPAVRQEYVALWGYLMRKVREELMRRKGNRRDGREEEEVEERSGKRRKTAQ